MSSKLSLLLTLLFISLKCIAQDTDNDGIPDHNDWCPIDPSNSCDLNGVLELSTQDYFDLYHLDANTDMILKTIEFWINPDNVVNGNPAGEPILGFNFDSDLYISINDTESGINDESITIRNGSDVLYTTQNLGGNWNHVAITSTGNTYDKIFVNGVQLNTVGSAPVFEANGVFAGISGTGASYYTGRLDELRLWATERTDAQIQNLYDKELRECNYNGLIGYFTFDVGDGIAINRIENNIMEDNYGINETNFFYDAYGLITTSGGCTDPAACNYDEDACVDDGSCSYDGGIYFPDGGGAPVVNCGPLSGYLPGNDCCVEKVYQNFPACENSWNGACQASYENCLENNLGCTDPEACNYEANKCVDDGSCFYEAWYIPQAVDGSTPLLACIAPEGYFLAVQCCAEAAFDEHYSQLNGWDVNWVSSYTECATSTGCTAPTACNYDPSVCIDNGSCYGHSGCSEETACNYDPLADCDDSACIYVEWHLPIDDYTLPAFYGCGSPEGYERAEYQCSVQKLVDENESCWTIAWDETCQLKYEFYILNIQGCLDVTACNYNYRSCVGDGSCIYATEECEYCSGDIDGTGEVVFLDENDNGICDEIEYGNCNVQGACNYNHDAEFPSPDFCIFPGECDICNLQEDGSILPELIDENNNGICDIDERGCMEPAACNYDSTAVFPTACFYVLDAECEECVGNDGLGGGQVVLLIDENDNGICDIEEVVGCMNPTACNYNSEATFASQCTNTADPCLVCIGYDGLGGGSVFLLDENENGICDLEETAGCTDPSACNYNEQAIVNDLSCIWPEDECFVCTGETDGTGAEILLDLNNNGICDLVEGVDCPGDVNGDYYITAVDLSAFLSSYGTSCEEGEFCPFDFNDDGTITAIDLSAFLGVYGTSCIVNP